MCLYCGGKMEKLSQVIQLIGKTIIFFLEKFLPMFALNVKKNFSRKLRLSRFKNSSDILSLMSANFRRSDAKLSGNLGQCFSLRTSYNRA